MLSHLQEFPLETHIGKKRVHVISTNFILQLMAIFLQYTVLTRIKSQVTVLSPPNKNLRYLPELKVGL